MATETIISIRDLGKTYIGADGPVKALDGISLEIGRGEIFGIIGLSGAGKSTLVRCINMLERPTDGAVLMDGRDLGVYPLLVFHLHLLDIGLQLLDGFVSYCDFIP